MLVRDNRLQKSGEVLKVLKKGRYARGSFLTMKYLSLPGDEHKFAVVVSRKVFKKAVDRNRAKRLVRESVKPLLKDIKTGYAVVFLVQSGIAGKSLSEVKVDVKQLFVAAGMLKKHSTE